VCGAQFITKSNVCRNINSLGPNFVRLAILLGYIMHSGTKKGSWASFGTRHEKNKNRKSLFMQSYVKPNAPYG